MSYDFDGNELWVQQTEMGFNLSIDGSSLYMHDMDILYRYDDNGTGCDLVWEWEFPDVKSSRSFNVLYDIPIGSNGNIYLRDEAYIYIVSSDGQLANTVTLDESFYLGYNSNITLTPNNDILIGKGDLAKISNSGTVVWETSIDNGMIINPSFVTAPTISSGGNFYDAQLFGLYCVKSSGTLDWKFNAENGGGDETGNLHAPVLTHEGNIVSVAAEASKVRCFKGDGQGLATSGWPKPFGDYGNTSAK